MAVRNSLQLLPGDTLELDVTPNEITLRPVREIATLVKERGIWVYTPQTTITNEDVNALIEQMRDERVQEMFG